MTGLNAAKGGSTVNLKVEVFAGGTRLTGPDTISMLLQAPMSCSTSVPLGPPSLAFSAKGSSPAFDSNNGQYLVKWAVPPSPGSCWIVSVVTADGSSLHAAFQVK
jgi:hypothetical protein